MHPLVKKLAGQTVIYGLTTIVGRFLNYLLVPLHTYVFNPSEYGVVSELFAYVSMLKILFTYGMETAFFRYYSSEENKKSVFDSAFLSILVSTVLLTGAILLCSQPIANLLQYNSHPEYIQWFALILGLDALCAIPFAKLRMQNRPQVYSLFQLINIFTNIGLNVFFLLLCPYVVLKGHLHFLQPLIAMVYNPSIGVGYIFIANLIASLVTLLGMLPFIIHKKPQWDFALWKKMFLYALPLIIVGLAGMINETFDRAMLKIFLPLPLPERLAQIGIYSACYKLSLLMTMFIMAYKMAAEPFFFSEANREDAKVIYAKTMNYFVIVCSVIFAGVMLFIELIKYFIHSPYFAGLGVVPILLMANLCLGVYYNLTVWYKLTNRTRLGTYAPIGGAVITLLINYFFIPQYSYMASAWATFACYASMMVVSYLMGQKYYHVPYDLKKFFIYITSALLVYFISNFISPAMPTIIHSFRELLTMQVLWYALVNGTLLTAYIFFIYGVEKRMKNPEWNIAS